MLRSSKQLSVLYSSYRKVSSQNMSTSPVLDRAAFNTKLPLTSIKIRKEQCTQYQKAFKGHLFDRPRMKKIYDVPEEPDFRYILLKEGAGGGLTPGLPATLQIFVEEHGGVLGEYNLQLGYEDMSVDEVLKRLLPDGCEIPSSFEQVGHLAHMNLRDDVLLYKNVIGQVVLDKNPKLRTVVNKTGNIETEFRTFPMELLAGEEDFQVQVKESGATFSFNFKDVYWNSRLGTEHNRIISSILQAEEEGSGQPQSERSRPGMHKQSALGKRGRNSSEGAKGQLPVIADMMGGVGPFSVPLGKSRSCEVHCNDLNPASHACMVQNASANHCSVPFLRCYNMCGRELIRSLTQQAPARIDHVLMNLPQSATDFLDVFIGFNLMRAASCGESTERDLPIIHVYAFSTCVDSPQSAVSDIVQRCASVMQCPASHLGEQRLAPPPAQSKDKKDKGRKASLAPTANFITCMRQQQRTAPDSPLCFGHIVRNVSPKKVMVCLSFRLPLSVANQEKAELCTL